MCGRLRMNPDRIGEQHLAFRGQVTTARMVGSSVANMRGEASTAARVSALNSVDFPAFVYPTSATVATGADFAALPLLRADAAHVFDLLFDVADAAVDFAAVGFKLGFAGSAGADAAAKLRHLNAAPGKARQHVMQLRELHLQLAFTGARVARKNIENELSAVDHAALHDSFDIALLRGGEIVIEEKKIGVHRCGRAAISSSFPAPIKVAGSGRSRRCKISPTTLRSGAARQRAQLGERFFRIELGNVGLVAGGLPEADAGPELCARLFGSVVSAARARLSLRAGSCSCRCGIRAAWACAVTGQERRARDIGLEARARSSGRGLPSAKGARPARGARDASLLGMRTAQSENALSFSARSAGRGSRRGRSSPGGGHGFDLGMRRVRRMRRRSAHDDG